MILKEWLCKKLIFKNTMAIFQMCYFLKIFTKLYFSQEKKEFIKLQVKIVNALNHVCCT